MATLSELVKTADWLKEKHVPVIEAPETVKAGEWFTVTVTVGKEIPHPNTTEHHIAWCALHFAAAGAAASYEVARCEFSAHGASAAGPNQGPVYTGSEMSVRMKADKPGTLFATSYCNIHGLWSSSREVKLG